MHVNHVGVTPKVICLLIPQRVYLDAGGEAEEQKKNKDEKMEAASAQGR